MVKELETLYYMATMPFDCVYALSPDGRGIIIQQERSGTD